MDTTRHSVRPEPILPPRLASWRRPALRATAPRCGAAILSRCLPSSVRNYVLKNMAPVPEGYR
jgi:hypothetical protein